MANRIKGITVEIGGDTTKLSKALEGVNRDIKGTQTQLKDVQKLLKLDPTNTGNFVPGGLQRFTQNAHLFQGSVRIVCFCGQAFQFVFGFDDLTL